MPSTQASRRHTNCAEADAFEALAGPAEEVGVRIIDRALDEGFQFSGGHPFFLQVFGDHRWRLASGTATGVRDAQTAVPLAGDWLDRGFQKS